MSPQYLHKGGCSEISIELSIEVEIGSTDGSPLSRGISVMQTRMLDEFVAITGYVCKYAIQLLKHPKLLKLQSQQSRLPYYGPEVQHPSFWHGKRPIRSAPNVAILLRHWDELAAARAH